MSRTFSVGAVLFGSLAMAAALCLLAVLGSEAKSQTGSQTGSVSQGSAVDPDSKAALAAQKDLAEEDRLPDYTQVVDDTTRGRFSASGWQAGPDAESHDGGYVAAAEGAGSARFKVKIPTTNDYSVYAWWPAAAANATAARFGVDTASGKEWSEIDQRTEGGMWIKLGAYAMEKGERYVEVAPGADGRVVADAVAVVRGEMSLPPEEEAATGTTSRSSLEAARNRRGSGRAVVRSARRHERDKYRYSTCTRTLKSCTCLTKRAVAPFGHRMGMTEAGQWRYERSRRVSRSNLKPGDEVFFKEGGRRGGITHVGIYSGNGNIVHASSYFKKVVESKMRYINGYSGAKRFRF